MLRKLIAFSLPLMLCAAPPTQNLIVDPYFSPYIGADDLLSLSYGIEYAEDWVIKKSDPPKRGWIPSLERLGELIIFWEPYNYLTMVTQHEVFGHGFRVRSMHSDGANVKKYTFGVPPPYGSGGGATYFTLKPEKTTPFELNAITTGGVEATSILAIRLKLQWLQKGFINAVQTSLYQYSQQDLTTYILVTDDQVPFFGSGESDGDIRDYVDLLNDSLPNGNLSVSRLKRLALLNYAEPFTYYSLYAWWNYLITGKQMRIPMIPIGSYGYLPGLRLGLTPYGPEYYLENFLVKEQQPVYFYLRGGEYAGLRSYGFGIEHGYLWTVDNTPWGLRADVWFQPNVPYKANSSNNLETFDTDHQKHYSMRLGAALSLIGHKKISNNTALFFQLGGKTTGFLPGEPLTPAVIARLGFSFF